MDKNKKITLADISEITGLSIATISRTLSCSSKVKQSTKDIVYNAIETLNKKYGTENINQFLKKNEKSLILAIGDLHNPVFFTFLTGIENCARNEDYHVMQLNYSIHRKNFKDEIEFILRDLPVAGIIIQNILLSDSTNSFLNEIAYQCPVVVCFEHVESDRISSVAIDNFLAAKLATEYLISIGRKRIALLNAPYEYKFSQSRLEGYLSALSDAGIEKNESYIVSVADFNINLANVATLNLLQQDPKPDAIFAVTDTFAAAVIGTAKNMNLSVPNDLAIVGFDNTEISTLIVPSITTVHQPCYEMGYQGCNLLINKIKNPNYPVQKINLQPEFLVRNSTQ